MKCIGLVLDDEHNSYQQQLVEDARSAVRQHRLDLLDPCFAGGSMMQQIGHCYELARHDPKPDGLLFLLVAPDDMRSCVEMLARASVDCVFLNRIPSFLPSSREQFPERLFAWVAPDQEEIGRIQGRQCLRLLPRGGSVVVIRGARSSPSAASRESGFREVVGDRVSIDVISGRWQASRAQKALDDWFLFRAGRGKGKPDLIVCQNDAMAQGARRALLDRAAREGIAELAAVPILGCDGREEEGAEMVRRRELTATVVMPSTSSRAVEILSAHWSGRSVASGETLPPSSLPPVEMLQPRPPGTR